MITKRVAQESPRGAAGHTPNLAISRSTARKQILGLIAEGHALLRLDVSSLEALRAAEQRERQWVRFAIACFERMFEDDACARTYIKFQSRVVAPLSFEQKVRYFELRVQECIAQLESDFEQFDASATASNSRARRMRKLLPRYSVIGLACVAAVILLAAILPPFFGGLRDNPAAGSLQDQLAFLNGTGWVWAGDYNMFEYDWTWGPLFHLYNAGEVEGRTFPWVGDRIRLLSSERVVILDWATKGIERQFDPPASGAKDIRSQDFTPVTLRPNSVLAVAAVHWEDHKGRPAPIWIRVVMPS